MIDLNINKEINELKVLSVFDFDGTLTYHNSFVSFLYFTFGKVYLIRCLIRTIIPILQHAYYALTYDKMKEIIIRAFFTNINEYWLNQQAKNFCERYWNKLMRPTAILTIKKEINSGAEVVICSASPTIILQPFANRLGVKLIATQLEVKCNKLTGYIDGYNCRCAQKIIRLKKIYGDLNSYYLRVWGDSHGDYELLTVAQDPHWRYFHRTHRNSFINDNK